MATFEKLYIKFEEGNKESLDRACKEAERLGYKKWIDISALNFRSHGILRLTTAGEYYTSEVDEKKIVDVGFTEHEIGKLKVTDLQQDTLEDEVLRYTKGIELGYHLSGVEYSNYSKVLEDAVEECPATQISISNAQCGGIEDINELPDECCQSEDTKKESCFQNPYLYLFS